MPQQSMPNDEKLARESLSRGNLQTTSGKDTTIRAIIYLHKSIIREGIPEEITSDLMMNLRGETKFWDLVTMRGGR